MLLFYEANPANLLWPTESRDTTKNSCRISIHGLTYQGSKDITFLTCNETDACIPPCHETMKGKLLLWFRDLRCSCSAPPLHFKPGNSAGTTTHRKDINPGLFLQLNLSVLLVTPWASKTTPEQRTNASSIQNRSLPHWRLKFYPQSITKYSALSHLLTLPWPLNYIPNTEQTGMLGWEAAVSH